MKFTRESYTYKTLVLVEFVQWTQEYICSFAVVNILLKLKWFIYPFNKLSIHLIPR